MNEEIPPDLLTVASSTFRSVYPPAQLNIYQESIFVVFFTTLVALLFGSKRKMGGAGEKRCEGIPSPSLLNLISKQLDNPVRSFFLCLFASQQTCEAR